MKKTTCVTVILEKDCASQVMTNKKQVNCNCLECRTDKVVALEKVACGECTTNKIDALQIMSMNDRLNATEVDGDCLECKANSFIFRFKM